MSTDQEILENAGNHMIELHVALENALREIGTLQSENERLKTDLDQEKAVRSDAFKAVNQKHAVIENLMNENNELKRIKSDYISKINELTVQIEDMTSAFLEDTDREGYKAAMTLLYKVMTENRKELQ